MNEYIIGQLCETGLLVLLGLSFLGFIAASFYDVWITRKQSAISLQTKRLRTKRPHVTILVYAQNSAQVIEACLKSILMNRYRQYDVVVVNNKSTDETKLRLQQFQQDHPAARLRVYNKRKESTTHESLRQAYRKSLHGDIILTVRPDTILSKAFLKDSVAHFMALGNSLDKTALIFNEYSASPQTLMAALRRFSQISRQLMQKICFLIKIDRVLVDRSVSRTAMYRKSDLMNQRSYERVRYIYDSRLAVTVSPVKRSALSRKRGTKNIVLSYVLKITVLLYITYSLYMAITLQNTALLFFGWLLIVVWFCAAIWFDDTSKISEKLKLSFVLPSLYFFLYLVALIEMVPYERILIYD